MLKDLFETASHTLKLFRRDVADLYDIDPDNWLGETSYFLNLGFWDDAKTFDEAFVGLADYLAKAADLRDTDHVLDCGFGYGDQDIYWAKTFHPARIVGLNITKHQVDLARKRVAEQQLDGSIDLRHGSATEIPFANASYNKVLALETAFHYRFREDFLREAFRVLQPGGRIALTDIIPVDGLPFQLDRSLRESLLWAVLRVPPENRYSAAVYSEKLRQCGFVNVSIKSIADSVLLPFANATLRSLENPETIKRVSFRLRLAYATWARFILSGHHPDYVIVTADKPSTA